MLQGYIYGPQGDDNVILPEVYIIILDGPALEMMFPQFARLMLTDGNYGRRNSAKSSCVFPFGVGRSIRLYKYTARKSIETKLSCQARWLWRKIDSAAKTISGTVGLSFLPSWTAPPFSLPYNLAGLRERNSLSFQSHLNTSTIDQP